MVVRDRRNQSALSGGEVIFAQAKASQMGRIVTQVRLTSFTEPGRTLVISALVDTGSAYITLPNAWRESLGAIEHLGEVEVERADQSVTKGSVCGPVRVRIGEFRPIAAEVLFVDMKPNDDGEYEPLVGYIALEQAGAAVDMLGHVNNARYVEWACDSLPFDLHRTARLRELQVNFLNEVRPGERISLRAGEQEEAWYVYGQNLDRGLRAFEAVAAFEP